MKSMATYTLGAVMVVHAACVTAVFAATSPFPSQGVLQGDQACAAIAEVDLEVQVDRGVGDTCWSVTDAAQPDYDTQQAWQACGAGLACVAPVTANAGSGAAAGQSASQDDDPEAAAPVCAAAATLGAACNAGDEGRACPTGAGSLPMMCVDGECHYASLPGEYCETSADCVGAGTCVHSVCVGTAGKGESCSSGGGAVCKKGLFCDTSLGMCEPWRDAGSHCSNATDADPSECGPLALCNTAAAQPVCAQLRSIPPDSLAADASLCSTGYGAPTSDPPAVLCSQSRVNGVAHEGEECSSTDDCLRVSDTCVCSGNGVGTCRNLVVLTQSGPPLLSQTDLAPVRRCMRKHSCPRWQPDSLLSCSTKHCSFNYLFDYCVDSRRAAEQYNAGEPLEGGNLDAVSQLLDESHACGGEGGFGVPVGWVAGGIMLSIVGFCVVAGCLIAKRRRAPRRRLATAAEGSDEEKEDDEHEEVQLVASTRV